MFAIMLRPSSLTHYHFPNYFLRNQLEFDPLSEEFNYYRNPFSFDPFFEDSLFNDYMREKKISNKKQKQETRKKQYKNENEQDTKDETKKDDSSTDTIFDLFKQKNRKGFFDFKFPETKLIQEKENTNINKEESKKLEPKEDNCSTQKLTMLKSEIDEEFKKMNQSLNQKIKEESKAKNQQTQIQNNESKKVAETEASIEKDKEFLKNNDFHIFENNQDESCKWIYGKKIGKTEDNSQQEEKYFNITNNENEPKQNIQFYSKNIKNKDDDGQYSNSYVILTQSGAPSNLMKEFFNNKFFD